jgi:hypothetical protein
LVQPHPALDNWCAVREAVVVLAIADTIPLGRGWVPGGLLLRLVYTSVFQKRQSKIGIQRRFDALLNFFTQEW